MEVIAGGMGSRLERDMKATSGGAGKFLSLDLCGGYMAVPRWRRIMEPYIKGWCTLPCECYPSRFIRRKEISCKMDTPSLKKPGRQKFVCMCGKIHKT